LEPAGIETCGALLLDKCHLSLYEPEMILGFRHRGLKKLFERDDPRGLPPLYADKIRRVLLALDTAGDYKALDLPDSAFIR
jgi:hypothetical protein